MSRFDLAIVGGMVVDGAGNQRQRTDIAVSDGRIAHVGRVRPGDADRVIDAWLASVARTEGPPELTVPAQTPRRMLPAPGEDVSRTIIDILSADPAEPVGQRAAAG